ncbi:MAG: hypothetical protein H7Y07_10395 [Pyrinomonadaceae bacterium]|nr:hypothetical protein [Sphingobacteriaceae bacterium]
MKLLIYTLLSLFMPFTLMAQPGKPHIESVRIAFITQKLDLTPDESQRFWPIYNTYQQEFQQLIIKRNQQRKAYKQSGQIPEDDLKTESEILELRKRYRFEFAKVLPKQKAGLVYPAEREFMHQLVEQYKSRKQKNK